MIFRRFFWLMIGLFLVRMGYGQGEKVLSTKISRGTAADSAWGQLPAYDFAQKDDIIRTMEIEEFSKAYSREGAKFWFRFPSDERRFVWANRMLTFQPAFWKDPAEGAREMNKKEFYVAAVDEKKVIEWRAVKSAISKEICETPKISNTEKYQFLSNELFFELMLAKNKAYRETYVSFLDTVVARFNAAIAYVTPEENNAMLLRYMEAVFQGTTNYGFSLSQLGIMLDHFNPRQDARTIKWIEQKKTLLGLQNNPFSLVCKKANDELFDFRDMKGKVVLVDFWSINCSPCIERMPDIKKVYDKYKGQDFEVLSLCNDPIDMAEKAEAIKRKVGATWIQIMIGEKREKNNSPTAYWRREIWIKYGFFAVPQLLLFDREGRLVMLNGSLQSGDLEPIIKSLLN